MRGSLPLQSTKEQMFIKIHPKFDPNKSSTIAINLNQCQRITIYHNSDQSQFTLAGVLNSNSEGTNIATLATYPSYEKAYEASQRMLEAWNSGNRIWDPLA